MQRLIFWVLMVTFLWGCASIEVRKIRSSSDYSDWDKDMQQQADAVKGFRYYLPRPFVVVKKEFPVSGTTHLVYGQVTADGRSVILLSNDHEKLKLLPSTVSLNQLLIKPRTAAGIAQAEGDDSGSKPAPKETSEQANKKEQNKKDSDPAAPKGDTPTAATPKPETESELAITPSALTSPKVELSELFDVVYLPDFTEQYAIRAKAGTSKLTTKIFLENGWMMENAGFTLDNTAVGQFIFQQIGDTLDLARDLVRLDKGLLAKVAGDTPPSEQEGEDVADGTAEGDVRTADAEGRTLAQETTPTYVLLKVHTMDVALPGVYPVLKPKEFKKAAIQAPATSGGKAITKALADYPTTLVNYRVRETVTFEVVDITKQKPGGATESAKGGLTPRDEMVKKLSSVLENCEGLENGAALARSIKKADGKDDYLLEIGTGQPAKDQATRDRVEACIKAAKISEIKVFI